MNVFRKGFPVVNICCCTCRRVLIEVSWSAEDSAKVRATAKQSQGTVARFTSLNQRAPVLFTSPHGEKDLSNCIFEGEGVIRGEKALQGTVASTEDYLGLFVFYVTK